MTTQARVDTGHALSVAVIGAGTMGAGIAGELARAGCPVRLVDLSEEVLQQGMHRLDAAQRALLEAELLAPGEAVEARGRVTALTSLREACDGVDLVIEAVSESMSVKQEMFRRFDEWCQPGAVLASNTSGLSITQIATATQRPELVAGMHFWNPPHIVPLVEVTRGRLTTGSTTHLLMSLARDMGKRPILVRSDVPGFVGNRLQFAVMREALHILQEGIASAEDIDVAMTAGPGLRYGFLGPLLTADLGGLDVFHSISSYLFAELCSDQHPPAVLEKLVDQGKLGAKTGSGFYPYADQDLTEIIATRDRVLLGFLKVLRDQEGTQ